MATTRPTSFASVRSRRSDRLAIDPSSRVVGRPLRPRRVAAALVAACLVAGAPSSYAQTWRVTPSVSLESTFTDNVDLAASGQRRSDWVNELRPSVHFEERGAHTNLAGSISVPVLLYLRTSENNYVAPQVDVR